MAKPEKTPAPEPTPLASVGVRLDWYGERRFTLTVVHQDENGDVHEQEYDDLGRNRTTGKIDRLCWSLKRFVMWKLFEMP